MRFVEIYHLNATCKIKHFGQHVVTTQPHSTVYLEEPLHIIGTDDFSTTIVTEHTVHGMDTYGADSY